MSDDKSSEYVALGRLIIDESKVFIVRRKADGLYKIFHDGREEKMDPSEAEEK